MTTLSLLQPRSRTATLAGIIGFAAALAAASQVAIPLPGTPVPFTLQPLLVVLAGMMLGPTAGAASMALYLVAGAIGLPIFAPIGAPGVARLLGPTGGYLIAYPAAAFAAGWVARRYPGFAGRTTAAMTGVLIVYAGGVAQLTLLTGSATRALSSGVAPFVMLDAAKAVAAAIITGTRVTRRA